MFRTFRALRFLFVGPFILALLVVINLMTSPGHWWVKWPAFGIGIAWVISLLRVIRGLVVVGGLAALISLIPWMRGRARGVPPTQDDGGRS